MRSVVGTLMTGLAVLLGLVLTGCAAHYPADPNGTLERVTGSVLGVGILHNEPFVSVDGPAPSGSDDGLRSIDVAAGAS